MKKLFATLTIFVASAFGLFGALKSQAPVFVYAENETSEQAPENSEETQSSEEETTSEETETSETQEQEPINVDEEVSKISQTAKDVIEVIKTVLNQPIVIGGVSVTIGAILFWVLGKILGSAITKVKLTKAQNEKITELLGIIGIQKDTIDELKGYVGQLEEVMPVIIENTKNLKVKEQLKSLYYKTDETTKEIVEDIKEQNNVPKTTQDTIKELLEK